MLTINCKGKILNLDVPLVMGIVNCTPDSFIEVFWMIQLKVKKN